MSDKCLVNIYWLVLLTQSSSEDRGKDFKSYPTCFSLLNQIWD